jgi:hypothetical protein
MGRYVFPPSMDFIKYPEEVNPFAMYIFEFEHQLNQQDLVDIWQNLPPRIGRAFDEAAPLDSSEIVQEKQITHSLASGELLEKPNAKLQWMIFKVKQKAQTNYWDKSVATNPSLNEIGGINTTLPKAALDGVLKSTSGEYNYNWPYDFFSLVELVKIDEEIEFTKNKVTDFGTFATVASRSQTAGNDLTQEGVLASTPLADPNDVSSFTVGGVVNAKEAGEVNLENLGADAKKTSNL